jgi:hypothetical protein
LGLGWTEEELLDEEDGGVLHPGCLGIRSRDLRARGPMKVHVCERLGKIPTLCASLAHLQEGSGISLAIMYIRPSVLKGFSESLVAISCQELMLCTHPVRSLIHHHQARDLSSLGLRPSTVITMPLLVM